MSHVFALNLSFYKAFACVEKKPFGWYNIVAVYFTWFRNETDCGRGNYTVLSCIKNKLPCKINMSGLMWLKRQRNWKIYSSFSNTFCINGRF